MKTKLLTVAEFADIYSGGTPSTSNPSYWNGDVPWITPKDLSNHTGIYIDSGERSITEHGLRKSSTKLIPADTVILSTRAPVGYVAIARNPLATNQGCKNMKCKEGIAHPVFIYYLLKSGTSKLEAHATGTTYKELATSRLKNISFELPEDIKIQVKIASILSAYDELIENNRRRIQLLEQAARLLYEEWFIHFRFPGHEHVKFIDGVPEGWESRPFSSVVDFKEGPGLRNYQYRDERGIPFLNIRTFNNDEIDLSKAKCIDETEVASKYQHFLLEEDDHVISSSGTLGRLVTIRSCHLPVMLNTSLIRMRPKKGVIKKWFLKSYLKYGDFIDQARSMATGAAQLNYGPSHLKAMSIMVPSVSLIELFESLVEASYKQIKVLLDCNLQLLQARDTLLPRLMSGKVRV